MVRRSNCRSLEIVYACYFCSHFQTDISLSILAHLID